MDQTLSPCRVAVARRPGLNHRYSRHNRIFHPPVEFLRGPASRNNEKRGDKKIECNRVGCKRCGNRVQKDKISKISRWWDVVMAGEGKGMGLSEDDSKVRKLVPERHKWVPPPPTTGCPKTWDAFRLPIARVAMPLDGLTRNDLLGELRVDP